MRNDERRWSELCARKALGRYYRAKGVATRWQRGSEPPDWWANLDGVRFAVEVTRAFGKVSPAGHSGYKPAEEQWAFARKLGRDIKSLVASTPHSGSHFVHIQSMMISAAERANILAQVREYVLRHLPDSQAAPEDIFKKKGTGTYAAISIEKKASTGAGAHWSYSAHRLPVGGETIERELRDIVTSAITSKTSRMSNIQEPKILVVVDTYLLAPISFWEELQVDIGPFSSVFRASPDGYCQPLSRRASCDVQEVR